MPDNFLLIFAGSYLIHGKEREMSATLSELTGAKSEYRRVSIVYRYRQALTARYRQRE